MNGNAPRADQGVEAAYPAPPTSDGAAITQCRHLSLRRRGAAGKGAPWPGDPALSGRLETADARKALSPPVGSQEEVQSEIV